jgi:dihydrolipoamide dehydrogenase
MSEDKTRGATATQEVDVAIIGVGTAGQSAAREVAKVTDRFVVIDDQMRGTTCAYAGCMPSKVLLQVADDFQRREVFAEQGIDGSAGLQVDGGRVMAHVRKLRDGFVAGVRKGMARLEDHLIEGTARFLEPHLLAVGDRRLRAKKIVLAGGSAPLVPRSWQALGSRLITTESLFELQTLPRRLAVIGLGPVGVEMGQALARLGVEVFGFEMGPTVGGATDPVISAAACETIGRDMALHLDVEAKLSLADDGGVVVEAGGVKTTVDAVLVTVGRKPKLAESGLAEIGVTLDDRGLPAVDPSTCRIEGQPIYLAGDVMGRRAVLHEASDEGRIAGYNAARDEDFCFARRVSTNIVFCDPNIVGVGVRYSALAPEETAIGEMDFRNQSRATIMRASYGRVRVYADNTDGRLLGAELALPAGEHLGHLLAWMIQQETTVFEALKNVYYHPTLQEGLRRAIRDAAQKTAIGRPAHELALCDSCACV